MICRELALAVNTYPKALSRVKGLHNTVEYSYHVCSGAGCCMVYRKKWKDAAVCPVPGCELPRYNDKGKAVKTMQYNSVIGWIQGMLKEELAK
jgi:hypothetical protein